MDLNDFFKESQFGAEFEQLNRAIETEKIVEEIEASHPINRSTQFWKD